MFSTSWDNFSSWWLTSARLWSLCNYGRVCLPWISESLSVLWCESNGLLIAIWRKCDNLNWHRHRFFVSVTRVKRLSFRVEYNGRIHLIWVQNVADVAKISSCKTANPICNLLFFYDYFEHYFKKYATLLYVNNKSCGAIFTFEKIDVITITCISH